METNHKMPRPLNENLGMKLSAWLSEVEEYFKENEYAQSAFFELLQSKEHFGFAAEEWEFITKALSSMLSLSFITQKNSQAIEDFYEDYNGF